MPLFILIVGIFIIFINYFAIRKENKDFTNILVKQETLHKDYDVELIAIRKDMAESILDIQKEIIKLEEDIKYLKKENKELKSGSVVIKADKVKKEEKLNLKEEQIVDDKVTENLNPSNDKATEIKKLTLEGYLDDDICKRLNMGKGELLLIRSLFK